MTSWGNGPWGITPWGGGIPTPTPPATLVPAVQLVDIVGQNLISLTYNTLMKNGTAMKDVSNYSVTSPNDSVEVIEILTDDQSPTTQTIYLKVTTINLGITYTVTVSNQFDTTGTILGPNNSGSFVSRITKQDFIKNGQTRLYNKDDTSIVASIVTALAISDDKIGGNQDE